MSPGRAKRCPHDECPPQGCINITPEEIAEARMLLSRDGFASGADDDLAVWWRSFGPRLLDEYTRLVSALESLALRVNERDAAIMHQRDRLADAEHNLKLAEAVVEAARYETWNAGKRDLHDALATYDAGRRK